MSRPVKGRASRAAHLACVLLALAAMPASVSAQKREVNFDVQVWGLMASYAFRVAPHGLVGLGVGLSDDQLALTIEDEPERSGMEQLQASLFYRWQPSTRWDIDVGVRTGISGGGPPCTASDCDSPDVFYGAYAGVFVGGRRLKVGTRALLARRELPAAPSGWVGHIELLTGRWTLAW